jgi:hypothetical protein
MENQVGAVGLVAFGPPRFTLAPPAHAVTFHELPYTFDEFERESPYATAGELIEARAAIGRSGYTLTALVGYWLRLCATLCDLEGVPLEEVAKRSLLLRAVPDAEVDGGPSRAA